MCVAELVDRPPWLLLFRMARMDALGCPNSRSVTCCALCWCYVGSTRVLRVVPYVSATLAAQCVFQEVWDTLVFSLGLACDPACHAKARELKRLHAKIQDWTVA